MKVGGVWGKNLARVRKSDPVGVHGCEEKNPDDEYDIWGPGDSSGDETTTTMTKREILRRFRGK